MATPEEKRKAILTVLAEEADYALGILARVQYVTPPVHLGAHNIYTLLRDMEREGILESYEEGSKAVLAARGGRPRRYYRLAAKKKSTVE